MKKNTVKKTPKKNINNLDDLFNLLQEFAIGGTITMNGSYEQAMNDTKNMAGLANIDAMQSSRFKDMQKMIQGVEMVTAMAGQLSSAIGGGIGDTSGVMTGETRQPVSTVNTMTAKGSTIPGFAFGGNILQENPKPKTKYIPATKRDSMNVQKQYLNRQKQLQKLGYTKEYDSVGDFGVAHQEMYKDFETMQKREKSGKSTQVIMNGMRNPMVYQAGVYREDNVEGNPFLYKTQESTDIGVINPEVPYSMFDKRITPTKKERWINKDTNDGVINYGYDFGEDYNPTTAKKGRTTPVNKNIVYKKQPIKNIPYTRPIDKMAFGGATNLPVEVEGQEVGETPNGELLDFQGPSHENGGIPIALPEGTEIYSKRIKVDGVSMADRKKKREKKTMTLESLFEKNKTDTLIKNSLNRTQENNQIEEDSDNKIQMVVKQLLDEQEQGLPKHWTGNTVEEDPFDISKMIMLNDNQYGGYGKNNNGSRTPVTALNVKSNDVVYSNNEFDTPDLSGLSKMYSEENTPSSEKNNNFLDGISSGATIGDVLGMAGNFYQADKIMKTIEANRAGDTPNINAFKDYGKKGLDTLDKTKEYVNQIRDEKLKDLELSRTGSIKRNQNSTRSINTLRALNLATDAGVNNQKDEMYNTFAQQMMSILGQQTGMENQKDQVVMQGEDTRDDRDRQDRDNYFSQLITGYKNKGQVMSETGRNLNQIKSNEVGLKAVNNMTNYVQDDGNGNISLKPGVTIVGSSVQKDGKEIAKLSDKEVLELYKKGLLTQKGT